MCNKKEEKKTGRFIHHNHYFISWLKVVKNVAIEKTENKKGFFIIGITKEEYNSHKKDYKLYKDMLKNINNNVEELKKVYRQK